MNTQTQGIYLLKEIKQTFVEFGQTKFSKLYTTKKKQPSKDKPCNKTGLRDLVVDLLKTDLTKNGIAISEIDGNLFSGFEIACKVKKQSKVFRVIITDSNNLSF
jgi:hypothetical protein